MIASTPSRQTTIAMSLGVFATVEGVAFLLAALAHTGMRVLPFDEPRIVGAAIVEGLCGVFFVGSAVSVFARTPWAWLALVAAHAFALLGVLVGISAIAAGLGPHSAFNDTFHRVALVVLAMVLIVLATPTARAALGWGNHHQ